MILIFRKESMKRLMTTLQKIYIFVLKRTQAVT